MFGQASRTFAICSASLTEHFSDNFYLHRGWHRTISGVHSSVRLSDQLRRRELSLLRQSQSRRDAQQHARRLASTVLSLQSSEPDIELQTETLIESEAEVEQESGDDASSSNDFDVRDASKMRGVEARKWFARQLMLLEWMIDVPDRLSIDWYVFARPSGKRCFVVSSNGTTVSRLRNGSVLHHFPSALPGGARTRGTSDQSYCILDCIFHELDQTYYVIDMVCWREYSLYDCTDEFRFFWLSFDPPSRYHKFRFSSVPVYDCDQNGLYVAYSGVVPYVKDGLLFCNKHGHYQTGNTPLALVWKDESCSQYVTGSKSTTVTMKPDQVVLELQDEGKLSTSDDPPIVFSCLDGEFIQKSELHLGNLVRFAIDNEGLSFLDGKLQKADLHYLGKVNRARAFADSYSKVMFQYIARHSPLKIDDLLASVNSSDEKENKPLRLLVIL